VIFEENQKKMRKNEKAVFLKWICDAVEYQKL